jgi:hypothetical protein
MGMVVHSFRPLIHRSEGRERPGRVFVGYQAKPQQGRTVYVPAGYRDVGFLVEWIGRSSLCSDIVVLEWS